LLYLWANILALDTTFDILFHQEDVQLSINEEDQKRSWLLQAIKEEDQKPGNLNFIFCSDDYLHQMNLKYLNHDTLTDVITFPMRRDRVEGDIFISVDRIADNAKKFEVTFEMELARVMIHGVLHLMGYKDKTTEEIETMRGKENYYLSKLK